MIKGFPSQSKLSQQNYNTVTPMGSDKHGIEVAPKAIFPLTGTSEAPASVAIILDTVTGKYQQHITFAAPHGLREGDVLRFDSGALISVEAPVIGIPSGSTTVVIIPMILQNITTSTCLFMRYVTLTLNAAGSLVTTAGPLEYLHNAVSTQVEIDTAVPANNKPLPTGLYFDLDGVQQQVLEDTVTPANNAPLPVKITSATGDINITAGDLNVQTSHAGASYDSMRVGDGTNLMGVNASLEALVHDTDALAELVLIDAKLPATLGSKADAASLAVTQSTEDKAALAAMSAKFHENEIDANNSTIATLGIGATYTGTSTDVTHFAAVSIMLFSDEDSAVDGMQFQFSTDNVNWDEVNVFNLETATSSSRRFQFPVTGQHFRVVYINGATAQGVFRVQTILHTTDILTSIHRIDASLTNDRSVQVTKSVIAGETSSGGGGFVNVKVNSQGAIEANCVGPEVKDFLDGGVVDTSGTPILVAGTSVVASLASGCTEIEVIDDIGEYMSLRDGAGTVLAYLPLGGGRVKVNIAAGTNIKLYSETGVTISIGKIAMNFLGS